MGSCTPLLLAIRFDIFDSCCLQAFPQVECIYTSRIAAFAAN